MRGNRDLRLAVAAAGASAVLALLMPVEVLSLLFAAPLLFFLPGNAIVAAVFARRPLADPQQLTMSIGLSLAVLALGGLVLNYVPGGIRSFAWAILLFVVTAAAYRSAALRRHSRQAWERPRLRLTYGQAALSAGAVLSAGAALVLAFTPLSAKHAVGYTEMWMQPYAANGSDGVRVGIGSDEQHRVGYEMRVRFGRHGAHAVRRFALDPGQSRVLRLPTDAKAGSQRVVAALYRANRPNRVYRRVSGWTVPSGPSG